MKATTDRITFVLIVVSVITTSIQLLINEHKVLKDLYTKDNALVQQASVNGDGGDVADTAVTGDESILSTDDDAMLEEDDEIEEIDDHDDDDGFISSLDDVALENSGNDDGVDDKDNDGNEDNDGDDRTSVPPPDDSTLEETTVIPISEEQQITSIDNNSSNSSNKRDHAKSSIPIAEASNVYIFPNRIERNQIETFDKLKDDVILHNDLPIPRDLNIVFMGDSLTRYQYLDLVYFLKYGRWVDPTDHPNFDLKKDHESWNAFYNFTNKMLRPYEQCDCYRQEGPIRKKLYENANYMENRYFRDGAERYNNTLTYLQKFGDDYTRSNWNVSDIHTLHENYGLITNSADYHPAFSLKTWVDVIEKFVCKMEPKPSLFIFNSGLWEKNNDLVNVTLQGEIVEALKKCDILSMYKTTTKLRKERGDRKMKEYEEHLCNQTDYCLDLTWTGIVPKELHCDDYHFLPPVYSYMNLQLLSSLSFIAAH